MYKSNEQILKERLALQCALSNRKPVIIDEKLAQEWYYYHPYEGNPWEHRMDRWRKSRDVTGNVDICNYNDEYVNYEKVLVARGFDERGKEYISEPIRHINTAKIIDGHVVVEAEKDIVSTLDFSHEYEMYRSKKDLQMRDTLKTIAAIANQRDQRGNRIFETVLIGMRNLKINTMIDGVEQLDVGLSDINTGMKISINGDIFNSYGETTSINKERQIVDMYHDSRPNGDLTIFKLDNKTILAAIDWCDGREQRLAQSYELEEELKRQMTERAKQERSIMSMIEKRAATAGKTIIILTDLAHTRFEDTRKEMFYQAVAPQDIKKDMDLRITGNMQDHKTDEYEKHKQVEFTVEQAIFSIDSMPFDVLIIESSNAIYVGFGHEREIIREVPEKYVEQNEREQDVEHNEHEQEKLEESELDRDMSMDLLR